MHKVLIILAAIATIVIAIVTVIVFKKQGWDVTLEAVCLALCLIAWCALAVVIRHYFTATKNAESRQAQIDNTSAARIAQLLVESKQQHTRVDEIANEREAMKEWGEKQIVLAEQAREFGNRKLAEFNALEASYDTKQSKLNDTYYEEIKALNRRLLEANKQWFRSEDTELRVECALLGTERSEPIDVTKKVTEMLNRGESVPVNWTEFVAEDPLKHATKFLTVVFSVTKRESNFINLPREKPDASAGEAL